ncbi:hypothetical protein [Streptomyces roseoverticillatus]|nr:hypothetical protein [Streptomyces roseoverticillatus]
MATDDDVFLRADGGSGLADLAAAQTPEGLAALLFVAHARRLTQD